ncbi:peroxidase [Rhodococcus sp. Leaf7]|uniref:iron uptake transporter deferrochelatase/peroxidase subunit n=1 Tax=unclassified Rhodococcus (in: high G+C Gram-positive bacteria) TaxID=192944 RepID=UPI0005AC68E4|nr:MULTISPECIES: iron uptake transporter deferrochelatase/peroxidase subunit [unclassified Rhodococcus (in: high G+C Gram-positive bacteria)]KIQ19844.1 peroxidase [Rhodococcus sp. MEB064]KQU06683.1 peroxidase [Rhodococcus sp. Leaf7]KQU42203.1 peroxidase [Rhodococcus sp. Leaf247]
MSSQAPERESDTDAVATPPRKLSRRALFGGVGAGALAVGAGAVIGRTTAPEQPVAAPADAVVPFRGAHQAGVVTPAQDRMHFVTFDVTTTSREDVVAMLTAWTAMAERLTVGAESVPGGVVGGGQYEPPGDTGEAYGLLPSNLTLTVGFGPSFFDKFGLADRKPDALQELPRFPGDDLDPARSGGDIAVQACADDPQVAVHAIRNLARIAFGTASVRWSQLGFGRTASTSTTQATPRNLFGFKDGTNNLKAEETAAVDEHVWVGEDAGTDWMVGGTYLVARRIRMKIEPWDRAVLGEQERVIGRSKATGAPLSGGTEFDTVDLGSSTIAKDAHVRLASSESLGGIKILRRGYNFTDGSDGFGHLDAGLFFIAFCSDPQTQFVPMQAALARRDALNEYISHVGSAVFACPPGVPDGSDGYWGSTLFA